MTAASIGPCADEAPWTATKKRGGGAMSYRALCALVTLALTATAAPAAENRIALVIGNSAYETVTALPNPANDAQAMADMLTAAGFEVISAPNAQSEMRQAISNFADIVAGKGPDTVALLFYAGHGLQVDGENFLVPIDARIQREADGAAAGDAPGRCDEHAGSGAQQGAHRHPRRLPQQSVLRHQQDD